VERDFSRRHRVADYAAELGVSPGHLNVLCRSGLRRTAGAVIRLRLTLEAKRLLAFGDLTAAQIAERLGFDDPAYFSRFFRRETGMPPTLFRRSSSRRTSSGPRRVRRRSPARRDGRR
jgi:AraC family transcriptional activator of pobA